MCRNHIPHTIAITTVQPTQPQWMPATHSHGSPWSCTPWEPRLFFGCDSPSIHHYSVSASHSLACTESSAVHVHLTALWHHMTSHDITLHQHTNCTRLAAVSEWEHHYMWQTPSNMPKGPKTLLKSASFVDSQECNLPQKEKQIKRPNTMLPCLWPVYTVVSGAELGVRLKLKVRQHVLSTHETICKSY